MKRKFLAMLFMNMLFCITTLFGSYSNQEISYKHKFVINLSDVEFTDNGMIWIFKDQNKIPIEQISFENGEYVVLLDPSFLGFWKCYECGWFNSMWSESCMKCGALQPNFEEGSQMEILGEEEDYLEEDVS